MAEAAGRVKRRATWRGAWVRALGEQNYLQSALGEIATDDSATGS